MKEHKGIVWAGEVKVAETTIFLRDEDLPSFKKFINFLDTHRTMNVDFIPVDESDKPIALEASRG